jgi:hypothetical protein
MTATIEELQSRLSALEAENAALRTTPAEAPRSRRPRTWGRTLLATVLIVLGALLAPVAVVATWANVQLTDTDRFVTSYAPLADDPAIQSLVTTQVVAVIEEQVDIPTLTSDVIDGIIDLGTGDRATRALELLKGPTAQGIQSLVGNVVARFVESDAFANVWASALRVSHSQVTGALQNDANVAIDLGADGTIGIQLAPIIEAVKQALVSQGVGFASSIPAIDRTIVVATSDALPTVQLAYGLAVAAGIWLPWISLLLLAAGVIAAHRRWVAGIAASLSLAASMVILLAGFAIGRVFFDAAMRSGPVAPDAAGVLFETLTGAMRDTAIAVLVLALVVAIVVWFSGPFTAPSRLRAATHSGAGRIRAALESHGVTTGRVGRWLSAQRTLLRVAVAVIGAAVVLLVRPITPGLVLWTLALAALVILLLEIAERPPEVLPTSEADKHDPEADTDDPTVDADDRTVDAGTRRPED